ncbi:MAG: OmpH family outer membrane protein [Bacteroidetes bacterium]|nr:OmpH family outer membrane protein [Bacteroidota bacterium]
MRAFLIIFSLLLTVSLSAQKVGCVDTKYILDHIPDYKSAENKLEQMSNEWQKEIEVKKVAIEQMYKNYQADKILLSQEMRLKKEQEIEQAEKELQDLQEKYFGIDGELIKQREKLVKPIQDKVFAAIKQMAESKGYNLIIDKAGSTSVLYISSKNEHSNDILKQLGY